MPKNWEKTGYLIPENIDPDENICICVPVPKDWGHIRAFMGQLTELSKWITWEKTGGTEAAQAARRWFDITECVQKEIDCAMTDGCGCGGSARPTNTRINPETGEYEVSYDGGITWIPDPSADPRFSGTVFPPVAGTPGDAMRCEGANSVVSFLEDMQAVELQQLETGATVADAIVAVLAALSALGIFLAAVPAAVFALVSFVVGLFAHLIPEDFESQFNSDVWDELLCIVYCNIGADGSFTEETWAKTWIEAVGVGSEYAGIWLSEHIKMIGVVGLTNAARAHYPGTRDCDGCNCDPECVDENWVQQGIVVASGDGWIEIQAEIGTLGPAPYGIIYGSTGSPDWSDYCCQLCNIEILSGTQNGAAYRLCDGTPVLTQVPTDQLFSRMEWGFTDGTAVMRFTFEGSPDCP